MSGLAAAVPAFAPGLNPRDALDILDIRASTPGGATELAGRTDAGPDVLHYLATHAAPATRVVATIKKPDNANPSGRPDAGS